MNDLKERILERIAGDQMLGVVRAMGYEPKREGREYKILCPFHADKKPSLTINTEKGSGAGIFKCFPCGWGGDLFSFVAELRGLTPQEFRQTLEIIAGLVGLGPQVADAKGKTAPIVQRTVQRTQQVEVLTAAELLERLEVWKELQIDPRPWAEKVGCRVDALPHFGGMVCRQDDRNPILVCPMRNQTGALCSIRYRDFISKKRWSESVKELRDGEMVTVKESRSGLMCSEDVFDDAIYRANTTSVIIEGETDLWAGISMMLDRSEDPTEWPADFIALPGVGTVVCHDMVLELPLAPQVCTFFDPDQAGLRATFTHKRSRKIPNTDPPQYEIDRDGESKIGLIERLQLSGRQARAAFPPANPDPDGGRLDLRDLYKTGWTWEKLREHILRTATADVRGRKYMTIDGNPLESRHGKAG